MDVIERKAWQGMTDAQRWAEREVLIREKERLVEECERYGLPHDLEALLRHLRNNHEATLSFKDMSIATLNNKLEKAVARIETLEQAIRDHLGAEHGTVHADVASLAHALREEK